MARNALPIHPSKRHPRTGEPLQALWVRPDGKPCWPIMGASEDDDPAGDGSDDPDGSSGDTRGDKSQGFPAGTPLDQMSVDQREAYWKHQARKHEQRAKNAPTADELSYLREKAARQDALEEELASDMEKAVKEARNSAQSEADAKYRPMLAETAFRVAIGDRKTQNEVDDFIGDLNLSRFISDAGTVDTDKVLARVEQFAPARGSAQQQRGPVVTPRGAGSDARPPSSLQTGRELFEQRHKKTTTNP